MSKKTKISDVIGNDEKYLRVTDFENFFSVYVDRRGNQSFNLNETLVLDFDRDVMPVYTCQAPMFWPLVSYNLYGTTRLAWLLMKLNDVRPADVFEKIPAGTKVRYAGNETVSELTRIINDYVD